MAKSADAFRTISEVAEWLETPAHVLRFWESKFSHVKPVKRAGGRRYYRPADMRLLGGIKKLLHDEGMTIKGVQKILREKGVKHVAGFSQPLDDLTDMQVSDIAMDVQPEPDETDNVVTIRQSDAQSRPDAPPNVEPTTPPEPEPSPQPAPLQDTSVDEMDMPQTEEASRSQKTPAEEDQAIIAQADADAVDDPLTTPELPLSARDSEEASEGAASDANASEPDTPAPVLPSFSHRRSTGGIEAPSPPAEPEETEAAPPAIERVTVPDDPSDDVAAPPGILTRIATLPRPLSLETAQKLAPFMDRLKAIGNANATDLKD